MWQEQFFSYIEDPVHFWPSAQIIQAKKLNRSIDRLSNQAGTTVGEMISALVSVAENRIYDRPPTIFLTNCGSSGSHWLSTMMQEISGIVDCGEVYLPKAIFSKIREWDQPDRSAFIDCVHLAHASSVNFLQSGSKLCNSAHMQGWNIAGIFERPKWTVLLLRDPIDIVLSRTFRKERYRKIIAPDEDDYAYVKRNIRFVQNFYAKSSKHSADLTIKYEDLKQHPVQSLVSLFKKLSLPITESIIKDVASKYSWENQISPEADRLTNIYRGSLIKIPPEIRDIVESEMSELRDMLGYS